MLRKLFFIGAVMSLGSILAVAQEPSKVDIFGGYQYLHASSGVSGVDGVNFNGWNAARLAARGRISGPDLFAQEVNAPEWRTLGHSRCV